MLSSLRSFQRMPLSTAYSHNVFKFWYGTRRAPLHDERFKNRDTHSRKESWGFQDSKSVEPGEYEEVFKSNKQETPRSGGRSQRNMTNTNELKIRKMAAENHYKKTGKPLDHFKAFSHRETESEFNENNFVKNWRRKKDDNLRGESFYRGAGSRFDSEFDELDTDTEGGKENENWRNDFGREDFTHKHSRSEKKDYPLSMNRPSHRLKVNDFPHRMSRHDELVTYDTEDREIGEADRNKRRSSRLAKNWKNTFGTLGSEEDETFKKLNFMEDEEEEEEDRPHIRLSAEGRCHRPIWYAKQMIKLEKEGRIKEAIEMLQINMLQKDRVMPTQYEFNILLGILGRVGYFKAAFKLFNQMKKMGIRPIPHTYSALFNACANSPWPSEGLQRARKLEEHMQIKEHTPNSRTIIIMIKAFGVCGDIQSALRLLDDCIFKYKYKVTAEHLDALLKGFQSDQAAGFRHAILVWRLLTKKVKPEWTTYNQLLQCLRKCEIGDLELAQDLLPSEQELELIEEGYTRRLEQERRQVLQVESVDWNKSPVETTELVAQADSDLEEPKATESRVHCTNSFKSWECEGLSALQNNDETLKHSEDDMKLVPVIGKQEIVQHLVKKFSEMSVEELINTYGKIVLLGGLENFLTQMQNDGAKPDAVTCSILLNVIAVHDEEKLLEVMESLDIKPDIAFFNTLIYKRSKRKDYKGAKEIMSLIRKHQLVPDIKTYGSLVTACKTMEDSLAILDEMDEAGLFPTLPIMGAMVRNSWLNFTFKVRLIWKMKELGIQPDEQMIEGFEKCIQEARQLLVEKAKGSLDEGSYFAGSAFENSFTYFMKHYEDWCKRIDIVKTEHPWKPYKFETRKKDNKS